jgi:SAM-dependent methyltransferase
MALIKANVSTRYTYDFVTTKLPRGATRVLEVGCGDGALAALLQSDGLQVTAIDSDPEAVAAANAAGVDARLAAWPAPIDGTFDAILFTRSLHHIRELVEAVAAADRTLRPGGRIIVEDFRAEGGSDVSANWFFELARSLIAEGALQTSLEEMLEKLAPADHDLHSSSAIAEALSDVQVEATDAAYYFRYLEPHLRQPDMARDLLDRELSLIAAGSIDPLGKRFVTHSR